MSEFTGQIIGGYHIVDKLGEGGMAEVFRAYQPRLERYIALKLIRPELAAEPGFAARFEQEAKLLARLTHPNIVHVYDFGEDANRCYLAMELITGSTLKDWRRSANNSAQILDLEEIFQIFHPVCAALDYAHAQGVIHRDIKPANIMFTAEGRVMLNDFGIAKLMNTAPEATQTDATGGTPAYMAPEQVTGASGKTGPASDVYSLGVVLYELLTGQVPFTAETAVAVMIKQLNDAPPPPRTFNLSIPEPVEQVILKALAKEPTERYPRASEFLNALMTAAPDASFNVSLSAQVLPTAILQAILVKRAAAAESPTPGEAPFKGLQHFDEADADLFFGRERLVARLIARLHEEPFLTVIGASGSGKSSLVRAGLLPVIRRGERLEDGTQPLTNSPQWIVRVLTPTAHPLEALAEALTQDYDSVTTTTTLMDDLAQDARSLHFAVKRKLARLSASTSEVTQPASVKASDNRLLLVVDQFEELFTLCRDDAERRAFVDNLLTATAPETQGQTVVVVTLRADFYAHCAQFANLRERLARRQEYIGPMSAEELRRAIEEPARQGSWEFEPGLVNWLLHDVGDEPGALPLLSHALLETWSRRRGRTLTFGGYTASGGVRGAIAKTAESVYQDLPPDQQTMARNIFMRLTELGEGTQDTRRRAALSELTPRPELAGLVSAALQTLAGARLITVGEATVEVAHEALIREWPTLRQWLADNREGLRLHRHLTEAVQAWDALGRDPGELYRGVRLAQAQEWAQEHPDELNVLERTFLEAATELAQQEDAERETQRQRELEAAQQLAESSQKLAETERQRAEEQTHSAGHLRQQRRYLVGAFGIALVLLVVAALAGLQAVQNARQADTNAAQAVAQQSTAEAASTQAIAQQSAAEAERARAERSARTASARQLAGAALAQLNVNPERSILLALQAVTTTYSVGEPVLPEAEEALHQALLTSRIQITLNPLAGPLTALAYTPDGQNLIVGLRDPLAQIWDVNTRQIRATLEGAHTLAITALSVSPDGKRIATASADGTAIVWDAATSQALLTFAKHTAPLTALSFSPNGKQIATASIDKTAYVWDATTGEVSFAVSDTAPIRSLAFSPDGQSLALTSDARVNVWDLTDGQIAFILDGHSTTVNDVAFSPDGTRMATASEDTTARIWETGSGKDLLILSGQASSMTNVAFSPDGTLVATASFDGLVKVWDTFAVSSGEQELFTLAGHASEVSDLVFSPDGQRLATTSIDGTIKVWDLTPSREQFTLVGHIARTLSVAYNPQGTQLASTSDDSTAIVWDAVTGQRLLTLNGHSNRVYNVVYSPDGTRLATASADGRAMVWDALTGKALLTLTGHEVGSVTSFLSGVTGVAFSPDGTRLATSGADQTAKVWDAVTGENLLTLTGHQGALTSVRFSPDGARLLTTSADKTARVWDATTGAVLLTLTGHQNLIWNATYSPDGQHIATASRDGVAILWNANTGKTEHTLVGHTSAVISVAYNPDGSWLATGSLDGSIKIWDTATGQEVLNLSSGTGAVLAVDFSPDGRYLAATGRDKTVRVYAMQVEDLVRLSLARLTRWWTPEECQKFLLTEQCPPRP